MIDKQWYNKGSWRGSKSRSKVRWGSRIYNCATWWSQIWHVRLFFSPLIQLLNLSNSIHPEICTFLPFNKISLKLLSVLLSKGFYPCREVLFIIITFAESAFRHNSIVSSNHWFYFWLVNQKKQMTILKIKSWKNYLSQLY